jgi:uncharacterized membrane protein YozB (DUF420 family)
MKKMLQEITYYMIFGKPLIMYLGILVLACFLATAAMGAMLFGGSAKVTIKQHRMMAGTAMILAMIHAILGILLYF